MAPFSDYLADGVNDLRLKSKLLRSLTRDLEDNGDRRSRLFAGEEDLANVLEKVQLHGLLTEVVPEGDKKDEAKLREDWRSAVDAWLERLLLLVADKMPQKCWAGTCLLGVTIQECTSEHVIAGYTVWFEKLLQNIQASSNNRFVYEASYACLSDLFTRLSSFSNVKKDSTSFAGRLVQPILHSMDDDGSIVETAIDLLCTLIKFYPSAVYRYYDKVESALASKIMSGTSNMEILMKISGALALLPHTKGDSGSWSVIMQKLLISMNLLLNDVFEGLEEEVKGPEIMKLLVPPGTEAPPLWDHKNKSECNTHTTKRLRNTISPLFFSFTCSCGIMLTSPYTVPVTIPIRPLLNLISRVLNVDGSLVSATVLPSTTCLYQELLCSELPSFHLYILDLLIAAIKGLKSQLLPHAASVVHFITDYFRRATLPSIRAKVYCALELLLHSMGVGMSLYLVEHLISNASMDLQESRKNICMPESGNEGSLKVSPKKRKRGRSSSQSNGVEQESNHVTVRTKSTPLFVKIAALRAMETLLSVGGSLKSESWRLEMDLLLINVATKSLDAFTGKAEKYFCIEDSATSQEEYCLVALQALLSSLLSPSHIRPPYLSQGLELFQKGKLETGTRVSTFCEKALLALEVLIHPRDIPLVNYPVPVPALLSINEFDDDDEMYPGWCDVSDDEKPPGDNIEAKKSQGVEQEEREDNIEADVLPTELEKIESITGSPPSLGLTHAEATVDQLPSQDVHNIVSDMTRAVSKDTVEDEQSKKIFDDLPRNYSGKGKEVMNDSDSDSLDSMPKIVLGDLDTDSD